MDEKKAIYTLYSEEAKKVIFTIIHKLVNDYEFKNDEKCLEIFSVVDGKARIVYENDKEVSINCGDLIIIDASKRCSIFCLPQTEFFC